jgi:hypothetical protein
MPRRAASLRLPIALTTLLAAAGCGRLSLDADPGTPGPRPIDPLPGAHASIGLVSAVGGEGRVRVRWRTPEDEALLPPRLAVFLGANPSTLLDGTPREVDEASGDAMWSELPIGALLHARLAARDEERGGWVGLGPVLACHTGTPLYVDPNAPDDSGDGSTPASAVRDLTLAIAVYAPLFGRQVVWIAGGDSLSVQLPLAGGLHVAGGFDSQFALGRRDPEQRPTRLLAYDDPAAAVDPALVTLASGAPGLAAALDGVRLVGLPSTGSGLEGSGIDLQACGVEVQGCVRGFRLRSTPDSPETEVVLAGCAARGAVNEGLSVDGSFDLVLEGCEFDNNGAEGAALGKLYAPSGASIALVVRGSRFTRNGQEGLDAQLAAPPGAAGPGGRFSLELVDNDFVGNTLDGLRIDIDYEALPAWDARIVARGIAARDNGSSGIYLDLDSSCSAFLHRIAAASNAGDGIRIASESYAGFATVSSSAAWGNLGAGLRSTFGNVAVCASHCGFAGNFQGGFVAEVARGVAVSCSADAQPAAWVGVDLHGCVTRAGHDPDLHAVLPIEYARVDALVAGGVRLGATPAQGVGGWFELAGDDVPRAVVAAPGATLQLDPVPAARRVPTTGWFLAAEDADEDWRAAPGGQLVDAGWPALDGSRPDAGPFGGPLGGTPGLEDPVPAATFHVARCSPATSVPVPSGAQLSLDFVGGIPDEDSLGLGVACFRGAAPLFVAPDVVDGRLVLSPPAGGWRAGDRIELQGGLRSEDGVGLAAPVLLSLAAP